jgi:hypothetical protein
MPSDGTFPSLTGVSVLFISFLRFFVPPFSHSTGIHKTDSWLLETHAKIEIMQVKINVPDRLAVEAQARGISLEIYIEEILDRRLTSTEEESPKDSVSEAIDRIRELRKQNTLGGLRTKDLIHEGHKY